MTYDLPLPINQHESVIAASVKVKGLQDERDTLATEQCTLERRIEEIRASRLEAEVDAELDLDCRAPLELAEAEEQKAELRLVELRKRLAVLKRAIKKQIDLVEEARDIARARVGEEVIPLFRAANQEFLDAACAVCRANAASGKILQFMESQGIPIPHHRFWWPELHGAFVTGGCLTEGKFAGMLRRALGWGYNVPAYDDPELSAGATVGYAHQTNIAMSYGASAERKRAEPFLRSAIRVVRAAAGMAAE